MKQHLENQRRWLTVEMLPSWKAHTLTGDRKGVWSLSVTANLRLTFRTDTAEREICDVNVSTPGKAGGFLM